MHFRQLKTRNSRYTNETGMLFIKVFWSIADVLELFTLMTQLHTVQENPVRSYADCLMLNVHPNRTPTLTMSNLWVISHIHTKFSSALVNLQHFTKTWYMDIFNCSKIGHIESLTIRLVACMTMDNQHQHSQHPLLHERVEKLKRLMQAQLHQLTWK